MKLHLHLSSETVCDSLKVKNALCILCNTIRSLAFITKTGAKSNKVFHILHKTETDAQLMTTYINAALQQNMIMDEVEPGLPTNLYHYFISEKLNRCSHRLRP
jgi:hypothetical protein